MRGKPGAARCLPVPTGKTLKENEANRERQRSAAEGDAGTKHHLRLW
jgi:hypothetical protein